MSKISLCMIVKNEEANLGACLESVRDLVDEIVIVDTGSTDRTLEVAAEFGARTFVFPWCDDFAAARNESLRHARGEWFFFLDADDRVDAANRMKLQNLFAGLNEPAGYSMVTRGDDPWGDKGLSLVRLFKLGPGVRWEYRVHEQIAPTLLRLGYPIHATDIVVQHTGYQSAEIRRIKGQRNLRLLLLDVAEHPNDVGPLLHLGLAYKGLRRFAEAVPYLEKALARLTPENPEASLAFHNLVDSLATQGHWDHALRQCRQGLEWFPADADLKAREQALLARAQGAAAVSAEPTALEPKPRVDPGPLEPLFAQAALHRQAGEFSYAEQIYRQILEKDPGNTNAMHLLAVALHAAGKLHEAVERYREVLRILPNRADIQNDLGTALGMQDRMDDAIAAFERVLEINPRFAEGHNNLGNAYRLRGRNEEAVGHFQEALRLQPNSTAANKNLCITLLDLGRLDEAIASFRHILELQPDQPATLADMVHQLQHTCSWKDLEELSQRVIAAIERDAADPRANCVTPFTFLTLSTPTTATQQYRCARQWADHLKSALPVGSRKIAAPPRAAADRITVGYVSADFQLHATAHLIAELFEQHDRKRFAIFGYSLGRDDGTPMRRRLAKSFERFVDLKDASFEETAEHIAADGVDILVDLKGYTGSARPEIFALRPAPIQVNYLGYPGTMGADFIDYILVDDFIVPADQQPFFSEKLVHLPGCYQVNDSRREISPRTSSRAQCGLPETGFVFCSFNKSYKITPPVFDVWMRLLKAVPGSVLWLLESNRFAPPNLRAEAMARGVPPERLVFAPPLPNADHLARHRLADLFLDSFPVNAHTTASDALWAGCPVLTLAGTTFVSRVAGSLLRALGLSELITRSLDEYYRLAMRLAGDAVLLGRLRSQLAANRKTSRLFDAAQFARGLEFAYSTMWAVHASGSKPRPFAVSAMSPSTAGAP